MDFSENDGYRMNTANVIVRQSDSRKGRVEETAMTMSSLALDIIRTAA